MINEFELYHGATICRLIQKSALKQITPYKSSSNSSYVIDGKKGIYIKYSTKRLSPWRFTFKKEHQDEILDMKSKLEDVFVFLVCHTDGFACLSFKELKTILDDNHELAEWISVGRGHREKYSIKGSDGKLRLKVNVSDYRKIA